MFHKESDGVRNGTTIKFILTDEAKDLFTSYKIEARIKDCFRFTRILSSESVERTFLSAFKNYYKDQVDNFNLHKVYIDTETITASCAMIMTKDEKPFDFINIHEHMSMREFFLETNHGPSIINIFHKGVYIKTINSTSLFNRVVGDINIKDKIALSLDRNDLGIDVNIDKLFKSINIELLLIASSLFETITSIDRYKQYELFFQFYVVNRPETNDIYQKEICKLLKFLLCSKRDNEIVYSLVNNNMLCSYQVARFAIRYDAIMLMSICDTFENMSPLFKMTSSPMMSFCLALFISQ